MKLKNCFVTHNVSDEQILIDIKGKTFSGIIRSNKTAGFIVDCLKNETTLEEIVRLMMEKYEVSEQVATEDANKIIEKLNKIGALE